MATRRVGVREFRERMTEFLDGPDPVAITRHGQTVGTYVPVPRLPPPSRSGDMRKHLERLNKAAAEVRALMAEAGVTEEELIREFDESVRRERDKRKRLAKKSA